MLLVCMPGIHRSLQKLLQYTYDTIITAVQVCRLLLIAITWPTYST
jgi:hypothetical protein